MDPLFARVVASNLIGLYDFDCSNPLLLCMSVYSKRSEIRILLLKSILRMHALLSQSCMVTIKINVYNNHATFLRLVSCIEQLQCSLRRHILYKQEGTSIINNYNLYISNFRCMLTLQYKIHIYDIKKMLFIFIFD